MYDEPDPDEIREPTKLPPLFNHNDRFGNAWRPIQCELDIGMYHVTTMAGTYFAVVEWCWFDELEEWLYPKPMTDGHMCFRRDREDEALDYFHELVKESYLGGC